MRKLFNNKKGKDSIVALVLIGIIVFMAFNANKSTSTQSSSSSGGTATTTADANTQTVKVISGCQQSTSLQMAVLRRYTDVAQGTENVTLFQNGALRATIAHGGTTSVQSGINADTIDLYPVTQSTTFYARHLQGKLATCTASATSGDPQFDEVSRDMDLGDNVVLGDPLTTDAFGDPLDKFPQKVLQADTSGNSNWFSIVNDGQANQNTGGQGQGTGANLTIGQGGSGSVTITFRPGFNTAIGPKGNVLACQFPQAVYDSVAPLQVSYKGMALKDSTTKPSTQNYPLIVSNNTVRAYAFPGVDGRATPTALINIVVKADSNHNPAGSLDRINCTMFDSNYYQRQRDGKWVLDIENRDTSSDLGLGTQFANPNPSFEIGIA